MKINVKSDLKIEIQDCWKVLNDCRGERGPVNTKVGTDFERSKYLVWHRFRLVKFWKCLMYVQSKNYVILARTSISQKSRLGINGLSNFSLPLPASTGSFRNNRPFTIHRVSFGKIKRQTCIFRKFVQPWMECDGTSLGLTHNWFSFINLQNKPTIFSSIKRNHNKKSVA